MNRINHHRIDDDAAARTDFRTGKSKPGNPDKSESIKVPNRLDPFKLILSVTVCIVNNEGRFSDCCVTSSAIAAYSGVSAGHSVSRGDPGA